MKATGYIKDHFNNYVCVCMYVACVIQYMCACVCVFLFAMFVCGCVCECVCLGECMWQASCLHIGIEPDSTAADYNLNIEGGQAVCCITALLIKVKSSLYETRELENISHRQTIHSA